MKLELRYVNKKRYSGAIILSFVLLFTVFFGCIFTNSAQAQEFVKPDQVILTWTADPGTSQTITWLAPNDSPGLVQYMIADEYDSNFNLAQQVNANATVFTSTNYRYTVNLTGLVPDTRYIYRVGNAGVWSDALSFTTAAYTENFSFLYLGDVQSGYTEWGNMLNSITTDYPQIKFSLLGGDLTNNGYDENEWGQFLDAASGYFSRISLMPTLGNHDGSMYLNFFALPRNGPADLEKEFYSFDYGNAHVVVLNSNNNTNEAAKQWLQADLQNTTKTWKFAMFHHPAYPAFEDNKSIDDSVRDNWLPILEANGVDMAFVGHQHEYMRTYPMYQGQIQSDPETYGITYVMGNSGAKVYGGGSGFAYIAREETGSNFQVIDIKGNVMTMTSKKADGELIESYTIRKSLLAAPAVTADITQNGLGKKITLNFEDDSDWRAAITDINVNGNSIAGRYNIAPGIININAGVFGDVGDYAIVVNADGYTDAVVTQSIIEGNSDWYDGYISTVVGNGTHGYSGDGGPAAEAQLRSSYDVVRDNSGNLYIADSANYCVRMVAAADGTYYGIPMTAGNIYTIAGNGTRGYAGDGGLATEAQLKSAYGLAVDSAGNLYINDKNDYRIRKVDSNGYISTMAGNGTCGYSGDEELAINAELKGGYGLAVDEAGNLYIADGSNYCVRIVAAITGTNYGITMTAGNIYTIAGNGTGGYTGDGGLATSAQLGVAYDVVTDNSGNVYIADSSTVRKVDSKGIINTVAGNGDSGYSGDGGLATDAPLRSYSLALDGTGDIYIAEKNSYCIRRVDASGMIFTVAGGNGKGSTGDGGPAVSAQIDPYGIAVDSTGNLYIADQAGYRVRYVQSPTAVPMLASLSLSGTPDLTYNGTPLTYDVGDLTLTGKDQYGEGYDLSGKTVIWTVKSGPAILNGNTLTIVRGGTVEITVQVLGVVSNVFNLNVGTGELPEVNLNTGDINTIAGIGIRGYAGDAGPAINGMLNSPNGVAIDSANNVIIADSNNNRIRVVAAVTGTQYGINMSAGNIYTLAGTGTRGYCGDGGPAISAELSQTDGITVDQAGNIYVSDLGNKRIRKIDSSGIITTVAGNGERDYSGDGGLATDAQLTNPFGVAVDSDGNIFIGSDNDYRVRMVAAVTGTKYGIAVIAGNIYTVAGAGANGYSGDGGPATKALIKTNGKIAVDSTGNLYIADCYNNRVRKVNSSGIITTIAGNGTEGYSGDCGPAVSAQFKYPSELAIDSIGNLYIADLGNYRIRKVDRGGIITTVVGDGTSAYSGDGGPAISAQIGFTGGIGVDNDGNLYITEKNNHAIRYVKLVPDEVPDLVSLNLSGIPELSYCGTSIIYDLGELVLTATDSAGEAIDIGNQKVTWAVHSGPATVSGSTLRITGSGTVNVSALIYNVTSNILNLTVTDSGANPPVMTADPNDKIIGQDDVELTFTDDPAWRAAINILSINGVVLDAGKYTKDIPGKIIINGDVFQKAGDYVVVIKATGYSDTSFVQTIVSGEAALQITGDGVKTPLTFTMAQLEEMEQYKHLYSTINKWPNKKWFVGEGVKVKDLLAQAGMKQDATLVKFTARDGYNMTFMVKELIEDDHYLFPHFKEPEDGHIAGSPADAEEVEAILALKSANSNNFGAINDSEALRLVIGQRAVSEQVNDTYVKYVNKIEVFTNALEKWETPQVDIGSGNVAPGTLVRLSTSDMNGDKIYYTTDGSTPTLNSTMYNPIGSEWWSSRKDVLNTINHPIEIQNNTTIKAISIGPGKEDSDVATFIYQVSTNKNPPSLTIDTSNNTLGQVIDITFSTDATWETAITEITINGSALTSGQYTVTGGNISIANTVFTATGDYAIVIKATGYQDATVIQPIVTASVNPIYILIPKKDSAYTTGTDQNGITSMTINTGITGLKYFGVNVTPLTPHEGTEAVVFTHTRNNTQMSINVTKADFDAVSAAQAGFNVMGGDLVKTYIVDDLTNSTTVNPFILQ